MDGINAVCRRWYGRYRPAVLISPSARVASGNTVNNPDGMACTLVIHHHGISPQRALSSSFQSTAGVNVYYNAGCCCRKVIAVQ